MIQWVEANPKMDATRMWVNGFSQNSVWAIYTAYCFPQNFVGVYQGGATMSFKGQEPFALSCQSNVKPSVYETCKKSKPRLRCGTCAEKYPCEECQFYPLWPCYNPERPMIDCSANYNNDARVYSRTDKSDPGKAWTMHEVLKR